LKSFYDQNGYVLCEVSSASIDPSGLVSLSVIEPRCAGEPVGMQFLKEMVVNPEDGRTVTFKKFNEMQERRKVVKKLKREDLNTTFVPTKGRTRGDVIARTLRMEPGEVFKWDNERWQNVANSGLFELVRTKPTKDKNGNVQLMVQATEKPTRNLEYGVTKSLYTGEWEGEVREGIF
jgi:outer membrane protein assembly factor BamA